MGKTLDTLLSSIIYLLIWISFWGVIETIVIKFSKGDINIQFIIYVLLLIISYCTYVFLLHKKVDIKSYNTVMYKNDENVISPVFFN